MPLSEHEQRLLEQMERALYAEDPKFASALRGHDLRGRYRRRLLAAGLMHSEAHALPNAHLFRRDVFHPAHQAKALVAVD